MKHVDQHDLPAWLIVQATNKFDRTLDNIKIEKIILTPIFRFQLY